MVDKAHILAEIRRAAAGNGGRPLGMQRFYAETGIKTTDWLGKLWARWGDAIKEAGLTPNTLRVPYTEDHLLGRLASFARELGRFPTPAEMKRKATQDKTFPNQRTYWRLGRKPQLVSRLVTFSVERTL